MRAEHSGIRAKQDNNCARLRSTFCLCSESCVLLRSVATSVRVRMFPSKVRQNATFWKFCPERQNAERQNAKQNARTPERQPAKQNARTPSRDTRSPRECRPEHGPAAASRLSAPASRARLLGFLNDFFKLHTRLCGCAVV